MCRVSVSTNGNVLVVDGESYTCESREQAEGLCEAMSRGGFHIDDEAYAASVIAKKPKPDKDSVKVVGLAKKRYRDHFAASPQEEAECLTCLNDILLAETEEERDEAIKFYSEGTYPGLATMAFRAIEGLRKSGNVNETAELISGLSDHLPEVFSIMQRIYTA